MTCCQAGLMPRAMGLNEVGRQMTLLSFSCLSWDSE